MEKKKPVETQVHREAFELYFMLGRETPEDIKMKMIAEQFTKHRSTIYEWKRKYNWEHRQDVRDKEIHDEVIKRTNETIVENKAKYLLSIHKVLDQYEQDVIEGKRPPVQIHKTTDLDRIIKLALFVQGNDGTGTDPPKEPITKSAEEKKEEFNEYFNSVEAEGKLDTSGQADHSGGDIIESPNPTQTILEADPVSIDRD